MSAATTIDRARLVRGVVLLAWSGFFAWLWFSGEKSRYLGPRTYWVVIFGAVVLGIAAIAHLVTLRSGKGAPVSTRDATGMIVLMLPMVAVILIPSPELGSLAASRKATGGLTSAIAAPVPDPDREISFIDVNYAASSPRYADALGIGDGFPLTLVGFVSERHDDGTFDLTRFYVSCCAADAVPYSVEVDPGESTPDFGRDDWVSVDGELELEGSAFVLRAHAVKKVPSPDDPYLY